MTKPNSDALAERFVSAYADMILRLCTTYSLGREDAQDICQNVFLKLLQGAPRFMSAEHEKAWVLRVAINESKNLLKSAARRHTVPLEETLPDGVFPYEADSTVLEAVQMLPLPYREAVLLFYFEGYNAEEIAGLTGTSSASVRQRLTRARRQLKNQLEQEEDLYEPLYEGNG